MEENRITTIIISIFFHALLIIALALAVKFPVNDVKDKFNVLVYNLNPPAKAPPDAQSRTNLKSEQRSQGASKLGPESIEEPMKGLKKGPDTMAVPQPIPMPPPQFSMPRPGDGYPAKRPQTSTPPREQSQPRESQKAQKAQKTEKSSEPKKTGDLAYNKATQPEQTDNGESQKTLSQPENKELEETMDAVRRGSGTPGVKGAFSPTNPNPDLLSKFAGNVGLGGNDEEGEGGTGNKGSSGHVVSLDTTDLKYFSYFRHLKELIEGVWVYPKIARERGIDGQLIMEFTINEDGTLAAAKILNSSGYPFLDEAAKRALSDASPFPPLPKRWEKKELTISGNFTYYLYNKVR